MNAIISGRSGRALLIDGDSLKSFEVDDPSTLTSRQQEDLPYLFGEGKDLRLLEDATIEEVELELRNNCHFTWALDLTLISLDAELPADIRTEALGSLTKLFETVETLLQVENVLYAQPLPEDADLKGALELCRSSDLNTVYRFLLDLEEFQPNISEVCHAWESIPVGMFGSYEEQQAFRSVAVSEGFFQVLAKEPPRSKLFAFRMKARSAIRELPQYANVLGKWYDLTHGATRDYYKRGSRLFGVKAGRSSIRQARIDQIDRELILSVLKKTRGNHFR